jgi:MFS family permease
LTGLYVAGACSGALFFGWLTDRFGRKKLFIITLLVYLAAMLATAFSFSAWWFFLFRFLTGFGIGGEYAAINSAIDELIPSRHRGRIDILINGSYWLGAAGGALLTVPLLNNLPVNIGWRIAFGLGVVLGLAILLVRRNVPESPRWLFIHGRDREAEEIVQDVERQVGGDLPEPAQSMTIHQRKSIGFVRIAHTMVALYPKRSRSSSGRRSCTTRSPSGTPRSCRRSTTSTPTPAITSPSSRSATSSARCCSAGSSTPWAGSR